MAKPVTGLITFGSSPGPDNTGNLDTNYSLLSAALDDLGTYGNFLQDTSGAANSIVCASAAGITASLVAGLPLQIKVANTNTGATTVALNALPATALLNPTGSPMQAGQLRAGGLYPIEFDGTNYQLLGGGSTVSNGIYVNVVDQGADTTGTADSTTAINNAITAVSTLGGGTVYFPSGTYKTTAAINLVSGVCLKGSYGAVINATATSGYAITTNNTGVTLRASIQSLTIQALATNINGVQLLSCYQCSFTDVFFITNSRTNTCVTLGVNTAGATNPAGNYNFAFCNFVNVNQDTSAGGVGCGTWFALSGPDNAHVVTLNTFVNCNAERVNVIGWDLQTWCDSNTWQGSTEVFLAGDVSPANGIGWALGRLGQGVYAENIMMATVDTFGTPATDNRQGIVCYPGNVVKFCNFLLFEYGPGNIGGALNLGTNLFQSGIINQAPRGTTNYLAFNFPGATVGIGVLAANNVALLVQNAGQVSGSGQYGVFVQTAGFNLGSPTQVTSFGTQVGLSASGSPYTVPNLIGFLSATQTALGSNATATSIQGYTAQDQTLGATSNIAFLAQQNNHTVNDRAFDATGTAPSQFNGGSAMPAGGAANVAILFTSTSGFGIYAGSGVPTLSAAQGSLYLRSDGSSGTSRAYINNSAGSGTTWTAIDTVA